MPSKDVSLTGFGVFDLIRQQVDSTHHAARVSLRPTEKGVYGSYAQSFQSGVMAAGLAAASPIFSFRWSFPAINCLLRRLRISAGTDGTAFAQGSSIFDVIRASGFTAQDTSGVALLMADKTGSKTVKDS